MWDRRYLFSLFVGLLAGVLLVLRNTKADNETCLTTILFRAAIEMELRYLKSDLNSEKGNRIKLEAEVQELTSRLATNAEVSNQSLTMIKLEVGDIKSQVESEREKRINLESANSELQVITIQLQGDSMHLNQSSIELMQQVEDVEHQLQQQIRQSAHLQNISSELQEDVTKMQASNSNLTAAVAQFREDLQDIANATSMIHEINKIPRYAGESCTVENTGHRFLTPDFSHLIVCGGSNWKFVKLETSAAGSCKELYDSGLHGSEHSKSYLLLDSTGGALYETYCDMTSGGGGWTLVARAHGNSSEWAPASQYWYNNTLIAPDTAADVSAVSSMKSKGWLSINGQKVKVCYNGTHTNCAVFTHNLGISLSQLFANNFGVTVAENYDFRTLEAAFGVIPSFTYSANHQWCGLNLGDGCAHGTNPNVAERHTICRIGCIGDNSGQSMCRLDDYALGIGVSSCYDGYDCYATGTTTENLHYRDWLNFGFFPQTAFIYMQ
ncbi:angiopoietin-2-like isoform X2 [Corticium candelabrum]|uniref:angiopoietin-2-like isoform X2 n=1 Tax=Corticium candelabrum TaxID=121492 RepID=UPI002E256E4A|nr:angiopoietin-2-like isoform X2 [Corticium candelabrum]